MTLHSAPLIEEAYYYPFGLVMGGLSSRAFGRLENKKKFNGYEENKDLDINWLESFYRTYDPQLGRFWQVDPRPNEMESVYAAMGNNPVLKNDPLGDTIKVKIGDTEYRWGQNGDAYGFFNSSNEFVENPGSVNLFLSQVNDALTKINSGKNGAEMINNVAGASESIYIGKDVRNNYALNTIGFNPDGIGRELNEGSKKSKPAFISLAHELAHAESFVTKKGKSDTWYAVSDKKGNLIANAAVDEIYATFRENQVRAENGIKLRTHYILNPDTGRPVEASRIIKKGTRESIYFDNKGNTNFKKLSIKQMPYIFNQ